MNLTQSRPLIVHKSWVRKHAFRSVREELSQHKPSMHRTCLQRNADHRNSPASSTSAAKFELTDLLV